MAAKTPANKTFDGYLVGEFGWGDVADLVYVVAHAGVTPEDAIKEFLDDYTMYGDEGPDEILVYKVGLPVTYDRVPPKEIKYVKRQKGK